MTQLKTKKRVSAKKKAMAHIAAMAVIAVLSVSSVKDYSSYLFQRRMLCEEGDVEDAELLKEERSLATSLVAYVDGVMNAENDPCQTVFPDPTTGLFGAYPPITHEGGPEPNRPEGTVAYAVSITRCPEFYEPGVDDNPDPGDDIYEASAMIKDEICNSTKNIPDLAEATEGNLDGDAAEESTVYGIVNPNGVTCLKPGSNTEYYDRVSMLQDLGFRVEIVGQPITNEQLQESQPYINEHIEEDVGVRDTTRLHAWRLVEHPAVVVFDYDRIFQNSTDELVDSIKEDPDIKGYYLKKPACDGEGNAGVDTGFMVIRPSMEEFNNIVNSYLNTPYDPETGWDGDGHNQCDGKFGLPGFFAHYFAKTPGYIEIDRCNYSFTADTECITAGIAKDAKASSEIIKIVENGPTEEDPTTEEGILVNQAVKDSTTPIDEVRILPVDQDHPELSTSVVEEETIVVMQVYVVTMTSIRKVRKTTDSDGVTTTEVILDNDYQTSSGMIQAIADDPTAIESPDTVDDGTADSFVTNTVNRPSIVTQSADSCGKPTECPPDDPNWTRSQQLACQQVHATFFMSKRRTELALRKIAFSDLIGQFKPRSFLGYCKGPGPKNYIGLKDDEVAKAPSWQVVCEPMYCPFGRYVTSDCTCSSYEDPCEACPSGTRCQLSPTFLCIDCECGTCDQGNEPCCKSGDSGQCAAASQKSECSLDNHFFATLSGSGSVCSSDVETGIWNPPQGCGCRPNNVMPCVYNPDVKQDNTKCFACTAADMISGVCPGCNFCLGMTNDCIGTSTTEEELQACIATLSDVDRMNCRDMCTKF